MLQVATCFKSVPQVGNPLFYRWINMDQPESWTPGPADLDYSMMEVCNRPMISELENRKNIP